MANRLTDEKSVYLQQHSNNPVSWFAWGEDAFKKARTENKPLLVSIGYSTCHWCHVMEHESFEDQQVADFLNAHFVSVKVDREEHPDVDAYYMDALQLLTRRGGWPLNMFVTPDLKPFFGGTYFPKESFLSLLSQIQKLWSSDPEKIQSQAEQIAAHVIHADAGLIGSPVVPRKELSLRKSEWQKSLLTHMLNEADPVWGGFGAAPKFPRSHATSALLRAALASQDTAERSSALAAVAQTLKGMAYGGMRDHLAGGFHRYSTDERWQVPHFEKMLYDQALLIRAYSEAYRVFRESFYADIVNETVDYLESEMRLEEGGFAAAQDADSEGVEGKYYIWKKSEIETLLASESSEDRAAFYKTHSVTGDGNWEGENILFSSLDLPWEEWNKPSMRRMREKLLKARALRIPPVRDTKMIVSWNASMAAGLLQASLNCADLPQLSEKLLRSAERTLQWLASCEEGGLPRVVYGQDKQGQGYLEDYAFLTEARQLWSARTGDASGIKDARRLLEKIETLFRDSSEVLRAAQSGEGGLPRARPDHNDGAMASPLSVYVGCLLRQALFESEPKWLELALQETAGVGKVLEQYPVALTELLCNLDTVDARLWKAPHAAWSELWQEWTQRSLLAGDLLFTKSKESQFQACDFESCYARGTLADLKSSA